MNSIPQNNHSQDETTSAQSQDPNQPTPQPVFDNLINEEGYKKHSTIAKIFVVFIQLIVGVLSAIFGFFFFLFDGYCAGGKFCSRMPGFLAFLGAFLMVISITQFFLTSKKTRHKFILILSITFIFVVLLYGLRLLWYYS